MVKINIGVQNNVPDQLSVWNSAVCGGSHTGALEYLSSFTVKHEMFLVLLCSSNYIFNMVNM